MDFGFFIQTVQKKLELHIQNTQFFFTKLDFLFCQTPSFLYCRAKRKGIAVSILGTFPEQTKLAEIAKYSHYSIQPVKFAEDGALVEEEPPKPKKAPPRRRFR